MYQILLLSVLFTLIGSNFSMAQKWNHEVICSTDTLTVQPDPFLKILILSADSTAKLEPYKIVQCRTRSDVGIRFDIGVSNYYYGSKTERILGQHAGPNFSFLLAFNKTNVGIRFKPWTFNLKEDLELNNQLIPATAKLNVIKMDYFVGYSFDFDYLISVEPYIGYTRSSFNVINEEELMQTFNFKKTGGLLGGVTLSKYFKIKDYEYLTIFASTGYASVNYSKIDPKLDNGYFEWSLGLAYKAFIHHRFNKRVEK
ncbi:MAG: hypothetical protein OCD76_21495 [Reichenbachiella sp.]